MNIPKETSESYARLNARLLHLENSDGDSVFRQNRLNARLLHLENSDAESSIENMEYTKRTAVYISPVLKDSASGSFESALR